MIQKFDGKSFANIKLGKLFRSHGVIIQFLSLVCALAMCYYAWLNILEFQYKPNDYKIYQDHYLVRGYFIEMQHLQNNSLINLAKCQYFKQLTLEQQKVINMENKMWGTQKQIQNLNENQNQDERDNQKQKVQYQIEYTFPSKITAISIIVLDFLAFLIGNKSQLWSLRLYIIVWFVDMGFTLQCPLVQNINYGKFCIQRSPVLDVLSLQFLPATSGNLYIMILMGILVIPACFSVNLAKKNQLGIPCTQQMIQCWTYGCLSIIYAGFFAYCLFFYITSLWANPALGNIFWIFNTLFDYIAYCILVQQMKQKQEQNMIHIKNGQNIPQSMTQSMYDINNDETGLEIDLD